MLILKGLGKFLLYFLIFLGMVIANFLILVLIIDLAKSSVIEWLLDLFNKITCGYIDILPYILCFVRCYLTNSFLQSVALRFSGRVSLFVFSVVMICLNLFSLIFRSFPLSASFITVVEICFMLILAVRAYKNELNPDD